MKKKLLAVGIIGVLMASMLVGCGQRETASSKENNYTQSLMEQSRNCCKANMMFFLNGSLSYTSYTSFIPLVIITPYLVPKILSPASPSPGRM